MTNHVPIRTSNQKQVRDIGLVTGTTQGILDKTRHRGLNLTRFG